MYRNQELPSNYRPSVDLSGFRSNKVFEKILEAFDNGATVDELKANPIKYLVSGKTKELVICTGGGGLKISRTIITECAKRGDALSIKILENPKLFNQTKCFSTVVDDDTWAWFENKRDNYDRENEILIQVLKEGKLKNVGGWTLVVYRVYVEPWSYSIGTMDCDPYGSEYLDGGIGYYEGSEFIED